MEGGTRNRTMNERNGLKVVLGIAGLLAWMAYILACRASWSPDGSKVLFPYYNPEADEAGVALYNRDTGAVKSIFAQASPSSDNLIPVQWESDGGRAIAWIEWGNNDSEILLLPIEAAKPARRFKLPGVGWEGGPSPEVNGKLYLGGKSLTELNLETGEARKLKMQNEIWPFGGDGRVFYGYEREATDRDGEEGGSEAFEIGELDTEDLALDPLFDLKRADLRRYGVKDLGFPEAHGTGFALVGEGEQRDLIVICTATGLKKVITPEFPTERYRLGTLQWSPDGKTIYAAVVTPTEEEDFVRYSVGVISVDGGPAGLLPIALLKGDLPDEPVVSLQIALSPDGSTIATATAYLDSDAIAMEDRALYLLDVKGSEPKVTKVPLPPWKLRLKEVDR